MNTAEHLTPRVAPPALRLLERPARPARPAAPARRGFWQRLAELLRRPR